MQCADKSTLDERVPKRSRAFEKAEKQLGAEPFFSGAQLGHVEIAWLPLLHRSQWIQKHSGHDMLAPYPKVKAWQVALGKSGTPELSVPDDFEGRFAQLYLAECTWFGRGANLGEVQAKKEAHASSSCCG